MVFNRLWISSQCCLMVNHFEHTAVSCHICLVIVCKHDVIQKLEIHNISQHYQGRTEPQPQATSIKICKGWTALFLDIPADRHTNRHADHNSLGQSNYHAEIPA